MILFYTYPGVSTEPNIEIIMRSLTFVRGGC